MAYSQRTYCNPIWTKGFADPFLLKVRGRYYAYASESEPYPAEGSWVFPILTSTDLVTWHEVGQALPALGSPYFCYWAPEVTVHNGQFFLYYAVHTEEFKSSIRVAVADKPEGPFVDSGHDLTGHLVPWAIDPHVFRDQDRQWYLYMTIEYLDGSTGFIGSGNAVDKLIDPFTLQGTITRVTPPSAQWQLFEAQRQSKGGIDWYTVEAPTVIKHRNRYYEMYSGGCFYRDNYAVSYATSDTPMGTGGLQASPWQNWSGIDEGPFLVRGTKGHLISPGHNSLVAGPNNVDHYLAYHAWRPEMKERLPCIDRLFLLGEELWTAAPTDTPQRCPSMPRLHDLFEGTELSSYWIKDGGTWDLADNEVIQQNVTCDCATLRYQETLSSNWLLEINHRHITGQGAYGVALYNATSIITHFIIIKGTQLSWVETSQPELVKGITLPNDFKPHAWHQLFLSLSGSLLTVQLDGFLVLEVITEATFHTFALMTTSCSAAFSGISLTDYYRDEFLHTQLTPAQLGWTTLSDKAAEPIWSIQDGTLKQISTDPDEYRLVKGTLSQRCEFGASILLCEPVHSLQASYGLIIWESGQDGLYIWLSAHPSQHELIIEGSGVLHEYHKSFLLPQTFNPHQWHTLHLEHRNRQVHIYLDGLKITALPFSDHNFSLGIATRNAGAAFTSIWQTTYPDE